MYLFVLFETLHRWCCSYKTLVVRLPCLAAAAAGTEADSLIAGEAGVCTEPYMEVSELVDVRA